MEEALLLAADPVVLADVFLKPPHGQLALLFRQPFRCAREVRQDEEGDEGDDDGGDAFDDENPAPMQIEI